MCQCGAVSKMNEAVTVTDYQLKRACQPYNLEVVWNLQLKCIPLPKKFNVLLIATVKIKLGQAFTWNCNCNAFSAYFWQFAVRKYGRKNRQQLKHDLHHPHPMHHGTPWLVYHSDRGHKHSCRSFVTVSQVNNTPSTRVHFSCLHKCTLLLRTAFI